MDELRNKIVKLLGKTKRKGMKDLIKAMDEGGFFTSPCSTEHHLCVDGGLAEHSWNVYETMLKTYKAMYGANVNVNVHHSIIICSLLHDLGKMGDFGKPGYVPNILASGKQSDSKPFKTNKNLLYIPHEIRSVEIARSYIQLTEEEAHAILFHNGKYTHLGYDLKETPMQMLLHFADLWSSRVIEKEEDAE